MKTVSVTDLSWQGSIVFFGDLRQSLQCERAKLSNYEKDGLDLLDSSLGNEFDLCKVSR